MKEFSIALQKETADNSTVLRIGGSALLPEDVAWPTNPSQEPLVCIASLPTHLLTPFTDLKYPANTLISVFTTYSKKDYFLDVITYHGHKEELQNIVNGFTKVWLHAPGKARNESNYLIPAREIELTERKPTETSYRGSQLGGKPAWLQNENLVIENTTFLLQLYSADFPSDFQDIFYLTDAVGYLFLHNNPSLGDCGLLFAQVT